MEDSEFETYTNNKALLIKDITYSIDRYGICDYH